jgi:hypothetical protein
MESIRINKGVCEPEIDMSRPAVTGSPRKVWRLLSSLLGSSNRIPSRIGTPRRSIDREQQQYAPIYD